MSNAQPGTAVLTIELEEPRKLQLKTSPEFGEPVRRIYPLLGVE